MTTEELNALIARAESGDVSAMNQLTHIYGEEDGFINHEQAAKWFFELIKRDCEAERPQTGVMMVPDGKGGMMVPHISVSTGGMMAPPPPSGMSRVYENTGYNKDLYEKIKNAILNSKTEEEMMASLTGGSSGGSLLGGAMYFTTSNAKSYINQAEEAIRHNIEYNEEQRRKAAEEEARKRAEEERARREAEERARREREEKKRQEERAAREREGIKNIEKDNDYTSNNSKHWEYVFGIKKGILIIPNGPTRIGNYAFNKCSGLTSIEIPNSVTSIGEGAFYGCSGLTSVMIPNSVTSIGVCAFRFCSGMTSIKIPNSVINIEKSAFSRCDSLTCVTIGDSVTSVGNFAFYGCTALTSVTIPNSVTSIGDMAFSECSSLKKIIIPKGTKQRFAQMEGLKGLEYKIVEE